MSRIGEYLRIKKHKARKEKYKSIYKEVYLSRESQRKENNV